MGLTPQLSLKAVGTALITQANGHRDQTPGNPILATIRFTGNAHLVLWGSQQCDTKANNPQKGDGGGSLGAGKIGRVDTSSEDSLFYSWELGRDWSLPWFIGHGLDRLSLVDSLDSAASQPLKVAVAWETQVLCGSAFLQKT